ncbi:IS30 family transposase [Nocardioides sp.]|uniref:IS30 family transposase n=1 Tax=Nocardioides sp. TaxID=35761 RepID=UPI0037831870
MGGKRIGPERRRELLDLLAQGLGPMEVARRTGVSKSHVYLLHHSVGGVYRPADLTYSGRYLDRDERYEIARLRDDGHSVREIGRRVGRPASTIARELARNRDPRTGRYQPERAHTMAWQRQRRPKASKLAKNPRLRAEVQRLLDKRWSPDQIAGRLRREYPEDEQMQISHETIYQAIYVYPRGELTRELKAHLRTGRGTRRRRGQRETRGRIVDAVSIHERPEEVEDRLVPGHHEGDLIKGSTASNSAVGTIVERTSGYVTLLHLSHGYAATEVADAVVEQMSALPSWFAKTLTWDRGTEMARHKDITDRTGINVYFADPYSPQQRPSNENTNGLLREYLPKGTDLSVHTRAHLDAIADELNDRPRKRLDYQTPREVLANLLQEHITGVATTP